MKTKDIFLPQASPGFRSRLPEAAIAPGWAPVVAILLILLLTVAVAGCGGGSPSATLDKMVEATNNRDCEQLVDLLDLTYPETGEQPLDKQPFIDQCNEESEESVATISYVLLEENIDGDEAELKVDLTTRVNDQELTETTTVPLVRRDGKWLLALGPLN